VPQVGNQYIVNSWSTVRKTLSYVGNICDKFDLMFTLSLSLSLSIYIYIYILNICTKGHCAQKRNITFIIYQLMVFAGLKGKGWSSLKKLFPVHIVRPKAHLCALNFSVYKSEEWISTSLKSCDKLISKDHFENTELFGISWIDCMHKNRAHS